MNHTLPNVERLLIVAPNWLGDAVMALPAMGDIRRHFSVAHLVVAARKSVAGLFTMTPFVDEVVTLTSGGSAVRSGSGADVASLRNTRADAVLLLPNSFASAWLARRAGVPERWGYRADLRGPLLTRAVARPPIRVHQAEYYRRLVNALGVVNGALEAEVAVPADAVRQAREMLHLRGWRDDERFVVMAPGAAYGGAKRWPGEYFADVAARLAREHQMRTVLVGAAADVGTARWVRSLVPEPDRSRVLDVTGDTTLATLAGVMSLARACISNDSGAMHLAAAVGVPLAVLFGPTRERETAPVRRLGSRVEVLVNHVWCRPCMLRECPLDHRCLKGLSADKVLSKVVELTADSRSRIPVPGL